MEISPVFFYAFAALAIACSLLVIFMKSPIASAFSLVAVFFAFAGIYAILDAHLIAALQVLVYAGAIMVLFVFVIMLLNVDQGGFDFGRSGRAVRWMGSIGAAALLALFIWAFQNSKVTAAPGSYTLERIEAAGGNTRVLSELMFSEYILPFELTSVLLLAAIIAAVAIAKRQAAHKRLKDMVAISGGNK